MFRILTIILLTVFSLSASAITAETADLNKIRVQYNNTDTACILVGSRWFKLDLATEKGKAAYSIALAAHTTKSKVRVIWNESAALEGGCDTGNTLYPLYAIETV